MAPQIPHRPTLGILGFGKLGTVLSQLALQSGFTVTVAASGAPSILALTAEVLTPGVRTGWATDVIESADIVILAIPLHAVRQLEPHTLRGKIVADATNHWLEVDGPRDALVPPGQTSSEFVQSILPEARVVKAFNHLGYHDLAERGRVPGVPGRVTMAVAGNDSDAIETISRLVDALGFDPLVIGSLAESTPMEPGHALFGAALERPELTAALGTRHTASSFPAHRV